MGPYVEKIQKGTGGVAHGVGPEFKPKCYKNIYIYIYLYIIYIYRERVRVRFKEEEPGAHLSVECPHQFGSRAQGYKVQWNSHVWKNAIGCAVNSVLGFSGKACLTPLGTLLSLLPQHSVRASATWHSKDLSMGWLCSLGAHTSVDLNVPFSPSYVEG
jgi:hypothetical protein